MAPGDETYHRLSRTLREALDAVVTPALREQMLSRALSQFDSDALPSEPETFAVFVRGPLRNELEQTLGLELAETLMVELERVARYSDGPPHSSNLRSSNLRSSNLRSSNLRGTLRRSTPSPIPRAGRRPTPVPRKLTPLPSRSELSEGNAGRVVVDSGVVGPASAQAADNVDSAVPSSRVVPTGTAELFGTRSAGGAPARDISLLLATSEPALVGGFAQWLGASSRARLIGSLLDLVRELDASPNRSVVVLDCRNPSLVPEALAAIYPELRSKLRVVLWCAHSDLTERLSVVSPSAREWVVVGPEQRLSEVVERCRQLAG